MHEDISGRDRAPQWVKLTIMGLIVLSIVVVMLETVERFKPYQRTFDIIEIFCVAVFTIEYFCFWVLSSNKARYPFSFMQIVDLLAILPFYLSMGIDLRGIRAIRLLRIFRVLKIGRYNRSVQLIGLAIKRVAPELIVILFGMFIVLLIVSSAMYYTEHAAQPEKFSSIPATLWWAVVTLTTVGYGDVYPITGLGKLLAGILMLLGIGLVAVPTAIMTAAVNDVYRESRDPKTTKQVNQGETTNN